MVKLNYKGVKLFFFLVSKGKNINVECCVMQIQLSVVRSKWTSEIVL